MDPKVVFGTLRALRALEKRSLPLLRTLEDRDLLCEIGYHQAMGKPLYLKQVLLLGPGSPSTVHRQVRRLARARAIRLRRSGIDRRMAELTLSRELLEVFSGYGELLFKTGA